MWLLEIRKHKTLKEATTIPVFMFTRAAAENKQKQNKRTGYNWHFPKSLNEHALTWQNTQEEKTLLIRDAETFEPQNEKENKKRCYIAAKLLSVHYREHKLSWKDKNKMFSSMVLPID